jgi:hypothetical protein
MNHPATSSDAVRRRVGLAAAVAPWLALQLKGSDPRLPFVAASVGVALVALALAKAWPRATHRRVPPRPGCRRNPMPPRPAGRCCWPSR